MTATRHEMPNGDTVWYRDSDHAYWERCLEDGKCSGRIPGISTIAKTADTGSNDGLLDWAARLTCEGVAREASIGLSLDSLEDAHTALSWMDSGDSIWETLNAEKLTWKWIRKEAGDRGSVSHNVLEALANEETPILKTGYDHAVVDAWHKLQPTPLHVEAVVYSAERGIAGRFDLLADIDGARWLIDLKTSKWIGAAFFAQLNLYALAAKDCGYPEPDHLGVLQVREDGTWALVECPIRPEWAMVALDTYLAGKDIQKAVRGAVKAAKGPQLKVAA